MDSFQWQEIFACEYIPLGSFLRGHDLSGAPCAGVFMYEGATCGHFELDFPGRQNQVHVSPKDVQVVPDDELTVEELAFAQELRRIIGTSTHALCSSFRGCPIGRSLLHAVLDSKQQRPRRDVERRARLREMIRASEEMGLYEIEEFELTPTRSTNDSVAEQPPLSTGE